MSWPAQRRIVAEMPSRIVASSCRVAGPNGRVAASCRAPPRAQPRLPARPARARPAPCAPACTRAPAARLHLARPASSARLLPACPACAPPSPPARPSAPAQRPYPAPCHGYSGRIVAWLGTVLQYSPALPSPLLTIQLYCIAIQFVLAYAAIHLSPLTVLQYSFLANIYLAIQSHHTYSLQYKLSCNTIFFLLSQYKMGSSPSKFYAQNFFSFFIINDFFFHLFPEIGKISKTH